MNYCESTINELYNWILLLKNITPSQIQYRRDKIVRTARKNILEQELLASFYTEFAIKILLFLKEFTFWIYYWINLFEPLTLYAIFYRMPLQILFRFTWWLFSTGIISMQNKIFKFHTHLLLFILQLNKLAFSINSTLN